MGRHAPRLEVCCGEQVFRLVVSRANLGLPALITPNSILKSEDGILRPYDCLRIVSYHSCSLYSLDIARI